ncbi:MAG TPA: 4Fe-4S dicluster domain-containing protein [Terracidiphilus sp.]|jgi:cytochrome c oxidase accessory protein FixG
MDTPALTALKPKTPRIAIPGTQFHRIRKTVQTVCFLVFVTLPMFNIMRFDLPRQRFYFFGAELWISEFSILFLTLMFLWILVAAMAMIYGRFYCGYLCPQMIFSEAANWTEKTIIRSVNKKLSVSGPRMRRFIAAVLFGLALLPVSVFVTFVFVSYFVPPLDLFHRLLALDIRTAGGIVGASVTLVTFLDFAVLRQRFCTAICPYGYLQNMLKDKHTLLVHFHDPNDTCIQCNKCVRACPMGIDIRKSAHQLECTHCAECIDACSGILGKLGNQTVIQYAWGDSGVRYQPKPIWFRRIGFSDGKRIAVLVLLSVYATGLAIAIGMRQPVLLHVMPDRMTLYSVAADGQIHNRFRVLVSNRGHAPASVSLTVVDLKDATIQGMEQQVQLEPGSTIQKQFDVVVPRESLHPGINRMRVLADVKPGKAGQAFAETFFAPADDSALPPDRVK